MIAAWSISQVVNLAAGSHTFEVRAIGTSQGSNATVSGDNTSVSQGTLTATILKL